MASTQFILLLLGSYVLGAVPSALLAGRIARGIDIREHGSGNVGAANAFRVLGAGWGMLVALLDVLKGFIPVWLFAGYGAELSGIDHLHVQLLFGIVAIVGHVFTVFGRFRGGKGVLTALGALIGLIPLEVGVAVFVFIVVFAVSRIVSLGSLSAAFALVVFILFERFVLAKVIRDELLLTCALLFLFVVITHRSNIRRLVTGTEKPFHRSQASRD